MRSSIKRAVVFVWVIAVACGPLALLSQVSAAANQGSKLTTSPISEDLYASPGSSASTTLQVQNNTLAPVSINVKLDEFRPNGSSGAAQIFTPSPSDPSVKWVHFSQTSFVAQPNVWNEITMTIDLPKTAALGYYFAVLFTPNNALNTPNTSDIVKGSNAVLILLDAHSGGENNKLSVTSFTSSKSIYQYLPASFSLTVHNDGNIFTVPSGDIYISRTQSGPVINTLDINSGQGNILPGTNRVFQAQWSEGYPVYQPKKVNGQTVVGKNGQPVMQLNWGTTTKSSSFRFGKYYARFVLAYNNGSREVPITGEVSFWVIPWIPLIGALLILLLVLLGAWTTVKSLHKKLRVLRQRK